MKPLVLAEAATLIAVHHGPGLFFSTLPVFIEDAVRCQRVHREGAGSRAVERVVPKHARPLAIGDRVRHVSDDNGDDEETVAKIDLTRRRGMAWIATEESPGAPIVGAISEIVIAWRHADGARIAIGGDS